MTEPFIDTDAHRAAVYASHHRDPLLREWARKDFLAWLERRDAARDAS
jgi:hypothetical protein